MELKSYITLKISLFQINARLLLSIHLKRNICWICRKLRERSCNFDGYILFKRCSTLYWNNCWDCTSTCCGYYSRISDSITDNILYGIPQEHRKKSLEDALKFLDCVTYKRKCSQKKYLFQTSSLNQYVEFVIYLETQFLLSVSSDGRCIILTLDIRYLTVSGGKCRHHQVVIGSFLSRKT